MTPKQVYKKAMLAWVKEIIEWQLKNPDRDWLQEKMCGKPVLLKWVDIKGYEGTYKVSNYGAIKSLDRTVVHNNGRLQFVKGAVMKLTYDKDGYLKITLNKNGVSSHKRVHQIVAAAFIPNPEMKPIPNHLNGIRDDNNVLNLRWATASENQLHSYKELGRKPPKSAYKKGQRPSTHTEFKKGSIPANKGKKYCKELSSYI